MRARPRDRHSRLWWLGLGVLAGLVIAVGPFLIPVRRPEGLVDADELADADSHFLTVDGVRLHYKEAGDPRATCTLVFIHGFASSQYAWRHAMRAFASRSRVIAFDRPGFGLSSRPLSGEWDGESPYSMASSARQTVELMDALGVEKAVLVGHSQGAAIAVLVADTYPERVSALVLVSAPTASKRFQPRPWLDSVRKLPQIQHIAPLMPRFFFGRNARKFMSMAYDDPARLTDETVELELKATHVRDWDLGYVQLTAAQTGFHSVDAMSRIHVPTLLVAGRKDRAVPYRDQVAAAHAIPGARIVAIADTGHVVQEERPEAVAAIVGDFLDELGC